MVCLHRLGVGAQPLQRRAPGCQGRRITVVHFDGRMQGTCILRRQPTVHDVAERAVAVVAAIAQGQHAVAKAVQIERFG